MMQSEQINELAKALAAAQSEIEDPKKTRTGKVSGTSKSGRDFNYEYKYADISDVLKNCRAALAKHEIAVTQPTAVDGGTLFIRTRLLHSSGQWIESDYPVCSIQGDHQKMGAAMTYARRYALTSLVGVAADEDTDGAGAAEAEAPKGNSRAKRTMKEISAQAAAKSEAEAQFCDALDKVQSLDELKTLEDEWSEKLKGENALAWRLSQHLSVKRADLSEPRAPTDEDRMDYVRLCLATIERAQTRQQLKEWWEGQYDTRHEFDLTAKQVQGLKQAVIQKRDSLPAEPLKDVSGREASVLDAG
jgi:hypothetical protein